jgi:hypothetical protein
MLGPAALLAALAGALAFDERTASRPARLRSALEIGLLLACVLNAAPRLSDHRPLPPEVRENLPRALTADAVRREGYSATVGDEYLPRAASTDAWRRPPRQGFLASATPPVEVETVEDDGTRGVLRVRAERPARLELARWAFPGWVLRVDGRPQSFEIGGAGAIETGVAAGESTVELAWRAPAIRRAGLALSAVAAAAGLALLGFRRRRAPAA